MALPVNTIGSETFRIMRGQIGSYQNQIEIIERPGLNGAIVRRMAKRGDPFTLETWVDTATIVSGRSNFNDYETLMAGDPQVLVWNDYNIFTQDALKIAILGVTLVSLNAAFNIVNPVNAVVDGFIINARWSLRLVP